MRSGSHAPLLSHEEADRFLMQQGGAGAVAGGNPLEMQAMRRELENVARHNNPLKGDRGGYELANSLGNTR